MNQCIDCGTADRAPGRSRCFPCYGAYRRSYEATPASPMKVLYLDIETELHKSLHFGTWNVNINPSLILEPGGMMCFSAKWQDGKNQFFSKWQHGTEAMVEAAHNLLSEADVVVHYYGSKFDIPHLNTEFLKLGMTPPAPYKQVDLKFVASKNFMFPSNKLQYVSTALGLDGKHKTDIDLWVDTMNGDKKAQKKMEKYNRQDVDLLEDLYHRLLPWVHTLPNRNLYEDGGSCVACGGHQVERSGFYYTALSKYKRYVCVDCGYWMRSNKRENGVDLQAAML